MKTLKPADLKKWMDRYHKSATDVASLTGASIRTVDRFLHGETDPQPLVLDAFQRLVDSDPTQQKQ